MNAVAEFLSQPIVARLGWALVHFLWQGAMLAALLAAALLMLRKRSPNARYLAACAVLAAMLAAPVATFAWLSRPPPVAAPVAPVSAPPEFDPARRPVPAAADHFTTPPEPAPSAPKIARAAAPLVAAPLAHWKDRALSFIAGHLRGFVAAWLAGVLVLSIRLLFGVIRIRHFRRRGVKPVSAALEAVATRLAAGLRLHRAVHLMESALAQAPITLGWLRPVILLPASLLTRLTPDQIEAILAHELAHVRRCDYLVNLFQTVAETLLFYHPAVWWVSRRIRHERELCCDDLAIALCGDSVAYVRALVAVVELRPAAAPPAVAFGEGGSLLSRIRRVLGAEQEKERRCNRWMAGIVPVAGILIVLGVLYVMTTFAQSPQAVAARMAADRDRVLDHADGNIRAGLLKLSKKFPQLLVTNNGPLKAELKRPAAAGTIGVYAFHLPPGFKSGGSAPVAEKDQYSVLVIVKPPPPETEQLMMGPMYPNLGLVGQVGTSAGDVELDAALKKLVADALAPLAELDRKAAQKDKLQVANGGPKIIRDFDVFSPKLALLLAEWRATRTQVENPNYDERLVIDLAAEQVSLEPARGRAASSFVPLPAGYTWSAHRVTPEGVERMGSIIRLQLRAPQGQKNACQEVFHVQGKLGKGEGIYFHIEPNGAAGVGTGVAIVDSYPFKKFSGVLYTVNESMLVTDPRKGELVWGAAVNGLQSRIVLDKRVFLQGEPIMGREEIRNVSDKVLAYGGWDIELLGPDGKPPPYIYEYGPQTTIDFSDLPPLPTVQPGKTEIFGTAMFFVDRYVRKVGRYQIRFRGPEGTKPLTAEERKQERAALWHEDLLATGNPLAAQPAERPWTTVDFEVAPAPGGGPDGDLVGRLLSVLPPGWRINGAELLTDKVQPPGRTAGKGSRVGLLHEAQSGYLGNNAGFAVYVMSGPSPAIAGGKEAPARYLGESRLGHVYATAWPAERWNRAEYDMGTALEVTDPKPVKPDAPDWGRTVCAILYDSANARTEDRGGLGITPSLAALAPVANEVAHLTFEQNIVPGDKTKPPARKDGGQPFYHVALSVRPLGPVGQLDMTAADEAIRWDGQESTRGYTVKRLGVEIVISVETDDAPFRKAMNEIIDREVNRVLGNGADASWGEAAKVASWPRGPTPMTDMTRVLAARAGDLLPPLPDVVWQAYYKRDAEAFAKWLDARANARDAVLRDRVRALAAVTFYRQGKLAETRSAADGLVHDGGPLARYGMLLVALCDMQEKKYAEAAADFRAMEAKWPDTDGQGIAPGMRARLLDALVPQPETPPVPLPADPALAQLEQAKRKAAELLRESNARFARAFVAGADRVFLAGIEEALIPAQQFYSPGVRADQRFWGAAVDGLQLGIRLARDGYGLDDNFVPCELFLRNVSDKALTVALPGVQMYSMGPAASLRIVGVEGSTAAPIPFDGQTGAYAPETVSLKPGQTVSVRCLESPLDYDMSLPGKFMLRATYELTGKEEIATNWRGKLTAEAPFTIDDRGVTWGKAENGLRAGLILRPMEYGLPARFVAVVQNMREKAVEVVCDRLPRDVAVKEPFLYFWRLGYYPAVGMIGGTPSRLTIDAGRYRVLRHEIPAGFVKELANEAKLMGGSEFPFEARFRSNGDDWTGELAVQTKARLLVTPWGPESEGLRSRVRLDRMAYRVGQSPLLEMDLLNMTDRAIVMAEPNGAEAGLVLTDAEGKAAPRLKTPAPPRYEGDGRIVQAHEMREVTAYSLGFRYNLLRPGRYRVQYLALPGAPAGQHALPTSNVFEFEILPEAGAGVAGTAAEKLKLQAPSKPIEK